MGSRHSSFALPVSIALSLSGCLGEDAADVVGQDSSSIISGLQDRTSSAVVMLRDAANRGICSGTLVSPTVVLTSAQCGAARRVGLGLSGTTTPVDVQQFRTAPGWNGNPRDGNDLAVAILRTPVTSVVPMAINRRAVHTPGVGADVSIVGFGWNQTNGTGLGTRRRATTSIAAVGDRTLTLSAAGAQQKCWGDMGGPTLATGPDGITRVVGVGSYADQACVDGSTDTRVDAYLGFIDQYVPPFNLSTAKTATGEFNGDGFADELVLYDYDNAAAGLWVFPGGPEGTQSAPYRVWYASAGNFDVKLSKVSAGDFNRDGLSDLVVLYDYGPHFGWGSAGLFVFPGTTSRAEGASVPFRAWFAAANTFDANAAKVAAGDFNDDGHDDLIALYDRSPSSGFGAASLFVFPGTDTGQTSPYEVWRGGANSFAVSQAKVAAGDFNADGKSDLIALYNYSAGLGWGSAGLFVFPGTTGNSTAPYRAWFTGPGTFDVNVTQVTAGDHDRDGVADLVALYDYTGLGVLAASLFVFPGSPVQDDSATAPRSAWSWSPSGPAF